MPPTKETLRGVEQSRAILDRHHYSGAAGHSPRLLVQPRLMYFGEPHSRRHCNAADNKTLGVSDHYFSQDLNQERGENCSL